MYKLMPNGYVKRLADGAVIPPDPANTDYKQFLVERDGGTDSMGRAVAGGVEVQDVDPVPKPVRQPTTTDIIAAIRQVDPDFEAKLAAVMGE